MTIGDPIGDRKGESEVDAVGDVNGDSTGVGDRCTGVGDRRSRVGSAKDRTPVEAEAGAVLLVPEKVEPAVVGFEGGAISVAMEGTKLTNVVVDGVVVDGVVINGVVINGVVFDPVAFN